MWSSVTETALIVIPEEAEQILSLIFDIKKSPTHLLTYAAPVTRKMFHFNDLKFYAVPGLPARWEAPIWLKIELGIYAGRLYFEHMEYAHLCKFLGVNEAMSGLQELDDESTSTAMPGLDGVADDLVDDVIDDEIEVEATTPEPSLFTKRPLTFLQEWLAVRRKGQDFSHTPMGHICQGKPLSENHPFFARAEAVQKDVAYVRRERNVNKDSDETNEDWDEGGSEIDVGLEDDGEDEFDDADLVDGSETSSE